MKPERGATAERGAPNIALIGRLLGEPARVAMLQALLSGRALTATELARAASVTAATASAHLARLTDAGLLRAERQGRHRYFRLGGPEVADTLERLMSLAANVDATHLVTGPSDPALRRARVCYDHLAGEVAVRFFDAATAHGWFDLRALADETTAIALTDAGVAGFETLGIDTAEVARERRTTCRACMDWSERRHHLAGALGARLLELCASRRWLRRAADSRTVEVGVRGERALFARF